MPEGDTIHRSAQRLRQALGGQLVSAVDSGSGGPQVPRLAGCRVERIEARGKHLLIWFEGSQVLHTHMGMTGSWHLYRPGEAWRKPVHRARVHLEVPGWSAVCFTPKTLEWLTPAAVRAHPHLSRLGPDLLANPLDEGEILRRLRSANRLPVGEAIMNQTLLCGVGNVYKSEVLFLERRSPFLRLEQLGDQALLRLVHRASRCLRSNLEGRPRTTRFSHDGPRLWVYGRSGEPCFRCGTTIRMRRQGDLGRSTYWCADCQPDVPGEVEEG
jgi:endonuclease VIII